MKVGMVTIGQSPRNDVILEIRGILSQLEIVEKGCLDELKKEQIESLKPKEGDPFLITLLRDGSSVQVSKEKALGLFQQRIKELESEDVTLIALLCTGDFPNSKSKKLLIMPGKLIHRMAQGMLTKEKKLGVIIPSSGQMEQTEKKWIDVNHVVAVASPYEDPEKVVEAAKKLQTKNVDLTVLDCIGYTRQMKQKVREITGKPVILARTILARVLSELLEN
jgi:protein AroM